MVTCPKCDGDGRSRMPYGDPSCWLCAGAGEVGADEAGDYMAHRADMMCRHGPNARGGWNVAGFLPKPQPS